MANDSQDKSICEIVYEIKCAEVPEKDKPLCETMKVICSMVTFGVFFDGTFNNKDNTDSGVEFTKGKDKNWSNITSYENDYSNVAKLFELYDTDTGNNQFKIYVTGSGTTTDEEDSELNAAFGRDFMVKINDAIQQITDKLVAKGLTEIKSITFNVFGFSRGAAEARNFAYQVARGYESHFQLTEFHGGFIFLKDKGIDKIDTWKVNFLGLFDTVLSHGLKHQEGDTETFHLNLSESKNVISNVLHLTAADEHRVNFALTDINSIKDGKNYRTFELPGVHSDIGGGYNNSSHTEEKNYIISKELYPFKKIKPLRNRLIFDEWYQEDELVLKIRVANIGEPLSLIGTRYNISNKYSLIPLYIMYKYAKNCGVPLMGVNVKYPIPSELIPVKRRLFQYVFGNRGPLEITLEIFLLSMVKTVEYIPSKDELMLRMLRKKYLHRSARHGTPWNAHAPNYEGGMLKRRIIKEKELNKDS